MSLRILRRFSFVATGMLGLVGGFVAWTVGEPVWYHAESLLRGYPVFHSVLGSSPDVLYASVLGLYLGCFLGATEGLLSLNLRTLARGMLFGSAAGFVGGLSGCLLGNLAFGLLGQSWIGRCLGWSVFGALLGVAPGMALKAVDRAARGFLGGAVGGFAGGFVFVTVAKLFDLPIYGRMLAIPLLGAILGACYGLAEQLMRRAWLTVLSGSAEGYEFALGGRPVTIGSSPRADLRLDSDPPLPGLALELAPEANQILLKKLDLDQVTVNNASVDLWQLTDGDVIRVRGIRILFSHRDGKQAGGEAPRMNAQAPAPAASGASTTNATSNPGGSLAALRNDLPAPAPSKGILKRALEGLEGKVAGHRFPLDAETITIGRDDGNDIVLDDLSVSLKHAEIVRKGKHYVVFDLSSSNGTFVQGRRISENALRPGFTVDIGQVKFKYVETQD